MYWDIPTKLPNCFLKCIITSNAKYSHICLRTHMYVGCDTGEGYPPKGNPSSGRVGTGQGFYPGGWHGLSVRRQIEARLCALPGCDLFQQDKKAWEFFQLSSPTTKKQSISWVMSAKREDTRIKRLNQLIACSRDTKKIPHLEWTKKKPWAID